MQEPTIVAYINSQLKTTQFTAARFQKGRWSGIAELLKVSEDGETMPCTVSNNGTVTKIGLDDTYPCEVYHRVLSANFDEQNSEFGGDKIRRQTSSMRLVFMGNREVLNLDKEILLSGISLGMPLYYPKSNLSAASLHACTIQPGAFITDKEAIYSEEFNLTESLLKPQTVMFGLDYTITTEAATECLSICN